MITFKALRTTETPEGSFQRSIAKRYLNELPVGDVLINVTYSSLNYKDALSATGHKGITRCYPHTPGVDAAGTVIESNHSDFQVGEEVIVTGRDLGMNTPGGFAEYIRVPADWVIKLPKGLSLKESMVYGTAGFTAALSIYKLQSIGLTPEQGEVLVTGATGGVGSVAAALLAKLGYQVAASTGKKDANDFLHNLGVKEIIKREAMKDEAHRPLLKSRWAGVVDTVGGEILNTALKSTRYGGKVSCCGLVASPNLSTTVYPFILRGISLLGIDSAECPREPRLQLWNLLANEWKIDCLKQLQIECDLEQLNDIYIKKILNGQVRGRVVVKIA